MDNNKFTEGYLYNDSFTEKEFLDAVIKNIKDDYNSPSYIFDEMKIGNIERIEFPIIQATGQSEIKYSRMLGFDRIETTTKYKTTTYSSGYQNQTHSTSSRTITDWKQDTGTIEGDDTSGTIYEDLKIYDEYITNHQMDKSNIRVLSNDELNKYSLSSNIIEYLKNDILSKVFKNNITYPTDKVKDEEYHGNTNLTNICITIVSLYKLTITIRDKAITFIASSNGNIDIKQFGEYPLDNIDNIFEFNRKMANERKIATYKERTIAKCSILSSIVLFILFLILGLILNILALTIISIVILVIGLIIGIKFIIDVKKISKPYYEKVRENANKQYNNLHNQKEESYQRFIKNMK